MRFIENGSSSSFPAGRYESQDLGSISYDVELLGDAEDIFEAFQDTGSCIENEPVASQREYAEVFADADNVHFYSVEGGEAYARAVELPTNWGDAFAVDAVKTGEDFDSELFRAGVNALMYHADRSGADVVLGGKEFFKKDWMYTLDLNYNGSGVSAADEVFFDQEVPGRNIQVGYDARPYSKGEQWDDMEEFFVKGL